MHRLKLPLVSLLMFALTFVSLSMLASEAQALCVNVKQANLRKGPGLNYEKLWEVFKYMPFQQLAKKGEWLRVQDVDGDIYWIHERLTTKEFKCAVIKQNKTNMRTGPGTNHSRVPWSPVDKYFSVKVLKVENNWVHILDAVGDKAWVYQPLVWIR